MNCVYPMMEAVRNDAVHSAEPIRTTLPCINNHDIDQLSKEKEEELLYGAGDEGDEEDTLSDDSMRLRLSDDEAEVEHTVMPVQGDGRESTVEVNETQLEPAETANVTSSIESEKIKGAKKEEFSAGQPKEHSSGNISMDEKKIITNEGKHKEFIRKGYVKPTIASTTSDRWPMRNNHWKSTNYFHVNSYRNANCFPYQRYTHPMPIEHDRYDQYDYRSRFNNRYPWFQQGRNDGNRNIPLYPVQQQYIPRRYQNNRGKPKFPKNKNIATPSLANKLPEGPLPSGNNISIAISESCTENNDRESTMKQLESSQELENNGAINPEGNLCSVNEFIDTDTVESNLEINSMDVTYETKFAEERNEGRKDSELDSGAESKDPAIIEASTSNEESCEKPVHSLLNSELNKNSQQEESEITVISNDTDAHTPSNSLRVESSPMDSRETEQIVNKITEADNDITNQNNSQESENIRTTYGKESVLASREGSLVLDVQKVDTIINEDKNVKQSDLNNHRPQEMEHIVPPVDSTTTELAIKSNYDNSKDKKQQLTKKAAESNNDSKEHIPLNSVAPIDTASQNGVDIKPNLQNDVLILTEEKSITREKSIDNANYENQRQSSIDVTKGLSKICKADSSVELPVANNILEELFNVIYKETTKKNQDKDKVVSVVDIEDKQSSTSENTISTKNELIVKSENEEKQVASEDSKDNINLSSLEIFTENPVRTASDAVTEKIIECLSDAKTDIAAAGTKQKRGRPKKRKSEHSEDETKVNDTGRQKRQTAKNAEEIIRKKFLNNDSDMEMSDDSEKSVTTNHNLNPESRASIPGSLKRSCPEHDTPKLNGNLKKLKIVPESFPEQITGKENSTTNVSNLNYVYKFFQRDLKEKLPKLTQEELEELLIQKIVETITMQGEIGRLREQARISQRNQEATRTKCQQLAKQIKDFEMVLGRYAADRRTPSDKQITPIKINRSVGLQVNFISEQGMQNLRQLQPTTPSASTTPTETCNNSVSPRRGIKIRPPRRLDGPVVMQSTVSPQNHVQSAQVLPTVPPTTLLVPKPVESQHSVQIPIQSNKVPVITNPQSIQPAQQVQAQVQGQVQPQAIVLNGKVPIQASRPEVIHSASKPRTNDLIDLTEEEEKNKVVKIATVSDQITLAPKPPTCFQRVLPANIAVTGQTASIRLVQPVSQPTPTALVNNLNTPRLAYVMQSGDGSTRQLLITSNSNTIRPVSNTGRSATFPTLTYKTGISSIANGAMRVLTTATPTVQLNQHPAPLPDPPTYAVNPALKLPPPAPSLKISKVATTGATGIVLSWNMTLSEKYADIVSYQLYAYQEVSGVPASTALWKKVGDVRALPLPMACTLTQFSKGNNYHFAVRAVDTHSRKGQYSTPGNISL